jgi:hypothetical protein
VVVSLRRVIREREREICLKVKWECEEVGGGDGGAQKSRDLTLGHASSERAEGACSCVVSSMVHSDCLQPQIMEEGKKKKKERERERESDVLWVLWIFLRSSFRLFMLSPSLELSF